MHAASGLVLWAAKQLAEIPAKIDLLPPSIMASLSHLEKEILRERSVSLDVEEALVALSLSATTNPAAELAMARLSELRGCEMHVTHIPTPGDEAGLRRLKVNVTSDPHSATKDLFVS